MDTRLRFMALTRATQFDIPGIFITVTSPKAADGGKKVAGKGKGKAKSDGLEILSNANLRLKEGRRYALVGRNGCGKSSMDGHIITWLFPDFWLTDSQHCSKQLQKS